MPTDDDVLKAIAGGKRYPVKSTAAPTSASESFSAAVEGAPIARDAMAPGLGVADFVRILGRINSDPIGATGLAMQGIANVATDRNIMLPLAGATLGTLATGGVGTAPILGAMGGAGLGEIANIGVDLAQGQPVGDPAARIGGQAALAGLGEGVGQAIGGGLQHALAPKRGYVNPEAEAVARGLRASANELVRTPYAAIRPSAVSRSGAVQWLEQKAAQHNMGRDILMAQDDWARRNLVLRQRSAMMRSIGHEMSDEDLGTLLTEVWQGNFDYAKYPAQQIYDAIDEITTEGSKLVDLPYSQPFNQVFNRPLAGGALKGKAGFGSSQIGQVTELRGGIRVNFDRDVKRPLLDVIHEFNDPQMTSGNDALNVFIRRLNRQPDRDLNWTEVKNMRDNLRVIKRSDEAISDPARKNPLTRHYLTRVENTLTKALDRSLADSPYPQLVDWLKTADKIYAGAVDEHMGFEVNQMMQLANAGHSGRAETIIERIFGQPGGQPAMKAAGLQKIRDSLRDPQTGSEAAWDELTGWYVRHFLHQAKDPVDGSFSGRELLKMITRESDRRGPFDARYLSILGDRPVTRAALRELAERDILRRSAATGSKSTLLEPAVTFATGPDGNLGIAVSTGAAVGGAIGSSAGYLGGGPIAGGMMGLAGAAAGAGAVKAGQYVLGGPHASYVAAKLLTNPVTAKWLAAGAKLPSGSRRSISFVSRLLAQASNLQKTAEYRDAMFEYSKQKAVATEDMWNSAVTKMAPPAPPVLGEIEDLP